MQTYQQACVSQCASQGSPLVHSISQSTQQERSSPSLCSCRCSVAFGRRPTFPSLLRASLWGETEDNGQLKLLQCFLFLLAQMWHQYLTLLSLRKLRKQPEKHKRYAGQHSDSIAMQSFDGRAPNLLLPLPPHSLMLLLTLLLMLPQEKIREFVNCWNSSRTHCS